MLSIYPLVLSLPQLLGKQPQLLHLPDLHFGLSVLQLGIYGQEYDVHRYLVNLKGVDLDHQDNQGFTALHLSVQVDNSRILNSLLSKRADVMLVDKQGRTPLDMARELDRRDCIKLLEVGTNQEEPFNWRGVELEKGDAHGRTRAILIDRSINSIYACFSLPSSQNHRPQERPRPQERDLGGHKSKRRRTGTVTVISSFER